MDLIRRIRWVNVARLAAVLGAVGLVVAWPRLRSAPPALPPAPVVEEAAEPAPGGRAHERPARTEEALRRRSGAREGPRGARRAAGRRTTPRGATRRTARRRGSDVEPRGRARARPRPRLRSRRAPARPPPRPARPARPSVRRTPAPAAAPAASPAPSAPAAASPAPPPPTEFGFE